jgi:hypothetical protein
VAEDERIKEREDLVHGGQDKRQDDQTPVLSEIQ